MNENGDCLHVDGGIPTSCVHKGYWLTSTGCETSCSYHESCIAYTYFSDFDCRLIVSNNTCPYGFTLRAENNTALAVSDLVPGNYRYDYGSCYIQNSGKKFMRKVLRF